MTYYQKSEDWLHHSSLLLQARPTTTKVTTHYSLAPARRIPSKNTSPPETQQQQPTDNTKPPRGHLILKTYDPHSGVTLKYKTSKAAEVSRLIQMLGQLGRRMAAVPDREEVAGASGGGGGDVVMEDVAAAAEGTTREGGSGAATPVTTKEGGAGGKKKKRGKR